MAANAIFSKVFSHASEDVTLHLIQQKCLPLLLYGTDACSVIKSDLCSLDFLVVRFLMKLFKTNNRKIIDECIQFFEFMLPSQVIPLRQKNLRSRMKQRDFSLCNIYLCTEN